MMGFLTLFAAITSDQVNIPKASITDTTLPHALQIFFGIASAVALLMIALGGFKYVLSRGDSNAIKSAKETIIYAAVGLIITMTGYGIVTFVVNNL